MDALEPRAMLAIAEAALDEVEGLFTQQVGADPVVMKPRGDFATETDLEIERRLRQLLTQYSGLPVYGEEFGGKVPEEHTAWVIDPIDGTTNYSNGFPLCAMLLTLMHEWEPVVGITSMPLLRRRITAAKGGGTFVNGRRVNIDAEAGRPVSIAFGSVIASTDGTLPRKWRQLLLSKVGERYPTIRITGSVGVDLGSTAMGAFGGTVTFSPHVWDNAAGVLQISEAGGVVTDLAGNPWRHDSVGVLAGTRDVHATLRSIIDQLGRPETFRS
ncbi:inositol monophosphatase [Corynebacterium amycolatum]|uniref:inositol monophosphatase family protein n=1 Tax=Corynebacterium amycolatum TaxID=43765 RepID=UPI0011EE9C0D|nr:inositol monophosphatase [Corynebacterium amycolatum]KAA0886579.1 inositol monophosphatase [Corynebacterium amycolatum]